MNFYEFNNYQYYALILAENEYIAKIAYMEEVASIYEDGSTKPDIIPYSEALDKYKKENIDDSRDEFEKVNDFNNQINYFNITIKKSKNPYLIIIK